MPVVELGPYRIEIAEDFGPRIIGLTRDGGPDLFARLARSVAIERVDGPPYVFHGGHRLWASPEVPSITYAPDDHAGRWARNGDTVSTWAEADLAGLTKHMTITLDGESLRVDHKIMGARLPAAAWGVTQLELGGTAIMTLPHADTAPLPDRSIVVWPYTDLGDPRLTIEDGHLAIEATGEAPIKLGVGPGRHSLGYWLAGWLFEKWSEAGTGDVPDLGAAAQVYIGQGFCELETVGVLRTPREPALLTEWWRLSPCPDLATAVDRLTNRDVSA
ncbi:MAG TPA: hypothetical protein VFS66_14475 [Acidimicrobiia bacterium]|nr:hypothetical protein [Acidimicrobiia bacterium]